MGGRDRHIKGEKAIYSHNTNHKFTISLIFILYATNLTPTATFAPIIFSPIVDGDLHLTSSVVVFPHCSVGAEMVIPPPVKPERLTKFLKPYVLKMHFTNKYVSAQVIHTPTATVASAASTQEKALRLSMEKAKENTRDVAAAAKIGKILGERLMLQSIPAVSVALKREQKYHGKVKAVIDSLREAGVNFL
ncbi:unnamed protein product [Fraxinus pennsylvanica]|uniref:50S ribosomal protein L18, chloroplastic n=1 Tax=Fraxinus pennsylvanica TaxID=56036 RepID=A0AAD1YNS1_9LAMI|nr:unnamed protein product [Fraxinus pennsylvanica]